MSKQIRVMVTGLADQLSEYIERLQDRPEGMSEQEHYMRLLLSNQFKLAAELPSNQGPMKGFVLPVGDTVPSDSGTFFDYLDFEVRKAA